MVSICRAASYDGPVDVLCSVEPREAKLDGGGSERIPGKDAGADGALPNAAAEALRRDDALRKNHHQRQGFRSPRIIRR
jgi:hypothetical protein